jgi:hypothetical protein
LHGISTSNTFEIDPNFNYDEHSIISITSSSVKPVHASTPINKRNAHSKSNPPLRVLNINFQSIKPKKHLVNNIIESSKPDIIIDTEIWLKPNIHNNEVFPENYNIYRKDRIDQEGGGALLAIKKDFISDEVDDMHVDENTEMLWAKIEIVGSKTLYVSSFYNTKTSNEQNLKRFDQSVRQTCKVNNAAILIGGDFNLPGRDWENKVLKPNTKHQKNHYNLTTTLEDTGLCQLIEKPTRNDNIPDLMITNFHNQVPRTEIIPGISEHDIVFLEFNIAPKKLKQKPRQVPIYKNTNWDTIKSEIKTLYDHIAQSQTHLNANQLNQLIKDHVPHKIAKVKDSLPWINIEAKTLIRKRDRLYKKMKKKTGNLDTKKKFKK